MIELAGTLGISVVAVFVLYLFIKNRYKKAGPDEALIVYGRRKLLGDKVVDEAGKAQGFRIVRGSGTFIWPGWEAHDRLSLKMMTLEINMPHVYTEQGIPINVRAVAQVKIEATTASIREAAEAFLGMPVEEVRATIQETVAVKPFRCLFDTRQLHRARCDERKSHKHSKHDNRLAFPFGSRVGHGIPFSFEYNGWDRNNWAADVL